MANGSFAVASSNKYVSAVVNWSSTPNTAGNYSDVYAELRASRTNSGYTTYGTGTGNWNINGTEVTFNITSSQKITYNSNTLLASVSVRVYHNNDGTKSCYIAVGASIPGTSLSLGPSGATPALDNIPRAASVTSATDFTDEGSTTINFSNPGGFRINARLEFGGSIIQRDNISNTGSYTFNFTDEERDLLRSKCATTNSMIVRHVIGTCIGGTTETHWAWHDKTMTIVNATPTINPTIKDTGEYSVPLTGNDQKIIKYFNYMNYDIGAVALKGASIVSQKITCGNVSYETATGGFNNVESGTFTIWVKDSRGNTNTKTVSLTLIEYVKISSSLDAHINLDSDNSTTINVIAFGNYFNGSFGAVNNTITLQYRYAVNDGEYSEWLDLTDITFETNSYQSAFTITSSDYKDVFKIQCRAIDKIGSKESIEKIVKVTPVFDWGENDFNFNVPVFKEGNPMGYYPIGGIYTSSDNTDPGELFGGTWKCLRTFYGGELIAYSTTWNTADCPTNFASNVEHGVSDIFYGDNTSNHICNCIPDILTKSSGTIWVQTRGIVGLVEAYVEISGAAGTNCYGIWFKMTNKNALPGTVVLTGGGSLQGLGHDPSKANVAEHVSYTGASSRYFYNIHVNDTGSSFYINPMWTPYGSGGFTAGSSGTKCVLQVKAYAKCGISYMWERTA